MTPGQVAYEKWRELVPAVQLTWQDLPQPAQAGWEEIAQVSIDWYKTNNVVVPE